VKSCKTDKETAREKRAKRRKISPCRRIAEKKLRKKEEEQHLTRKGGKWLRKKIMWGSVRRGKENTPPCIGRSKKVG